MEVADIFKISAPTSVRVARWAAIAALITALGSVFDTVWTQKPWWDDTSVPVAEKVVSSPPSYSSPNAPATPNEPAKVSYDKTADIKFESVKLNEVKKPFHIEKWLLMGSSLIGIYYVSTELFWNRFKKKKTQATLS